MSRALRLIHNPVAVLNLAPKRDRLVPGKEWPNDLPPPVLARDTDAKARACSLLCGVETLDGRPTYPSDITSAQARDVVAFYRQEGL